MGIEKKADEFSSERMNDFCPLMYESCGDPNKVFNFDCFGMYIDCPYRKIKNDGR